MDINRLDITRPAPPCPECGGARYWYGNIEFWVGGGRHGRNDNLNAAVCSNCGYSSLYFQNMPEFHQALAKMGLGPLAGDPAGAQGMTAASPPDRSESQASRRSFRKQNKPGGA